MKLLIYLVVFFQFFDGFKANRVTTDSLIRDACKKASKYADPHYYKFCIACISENPESKNVKNIDELIMVGVKIAIANMTNLKGIVEKILKERKYKSKLTGKLLRDCVKLYSEGNDSLTKSLEYLKLRDYMKVSTKIDNVKAIPRVCEMGFNDDNKQKSPVKNENDVLYDVIDMAQYFNYNAHLEPPPM
ncbi:PREDICTED: putative invertase inhibitor [Camelina sativa]|uniref:Invertase inhibitor n=1 Tax=Camelina sativa TaxID=90675 RepID=A0ABM0Y3K8_CAMSA|nr:PREDICTED: putative invertase inhibitor [Camelina sativa]